MEQLDGTSQFEASDSEIQDQAKHEIQTREIAELESYLQVLIGKLREAIEGQEYDLIIGDDTSGRIPTLILGRSINAIYEELGGAKIPIVFIQGSRYSPRTPRMERQLERILHHYAPQKKALLISDYIDTGSTVGNFGEILSCRGIVFDVAAIGVSDSENNYRDDKVILPTTKLFYGYKNLRNNNTPPSIFGKDRLTGLNRQKFVGKFVLTDPEIRKQVKQAREDATELSRRLVAGFSIKH